MAAHSNRPSSPISSRPTNPNSRSSEVHSTTRRSFNGNNSFTKPSTLANPKRLDPMTPANSPSDFARRRSVGSGSCLKISEEKENNNNEKDQFMRPSKLQSPAKGFMAPTISAASKFTPSPRKKVLVERNDPVRTSISLSDGKAIFFSNVSEDFEPKSETGNNQNPKTLPKPPKKVAFLDSQNANENSSDSDSLKFSCSHVSNPVIVPLDADPSTRPYDPKTNYLSPRPQFLYYKPNPRLKIENVMDMEDEIVSDNFSSDSEGTQDSEKERLEAIASADTVIGFQDDFDLYEESEKEKLEMIVSAGMFEGSLSSLEDDLREDRVSVDSGNEKSKVIESADMVLGLDEIDDDVIYVEKKETKSRVFSRLMCLSMVMMMLLTVGCISINVTQSRPFEEFGLKDLSFPDLGNLYRQSMVFANAKAAKVDFHGIVGRINHLAVNCVSFISKVTNELWEGEKRIGPFKYVNLSDLQMDSWNNGHFRNNNDEIIIENVEDDDDEDLDTEMGKFEEEEAYAENDDNDDDKDENFENEIDRQERDNEMSEIENKTPTDYSSGLDSEYSEDTQSQGEIIAVPSVTTDDQSAAIIIPQDQESEIGAEIEIVPSETVETEKKYDGEIKSDVDSFTEAVVQSPITKEIPSIFAAIFSVAAAFVVYKYKKISSLPANGVDVVQVEKKKEMNQEKAFSSYSKRKVDDDGESSCPSEMSSFQNSKRDETRGGASEAQSLERKTTRRYQLKRESLSSSLSEFTMGSQQPSYGSFTTYEKIPIKNEYGEDEIITPVRRSSRIRKITSP
ncbi:hypothetical protein CASFOL_042453 [Castilleja foliolosa]|uniref:Uncharacterized protein n=1 Tax=Castilleja foliolosa TaxID=1961234 RepID=A0ABD3BAS8_9LAMI